MRLEVRDRPDSRGPVVSESGRGGEKWAARRLDGPGAARAGKKGGRARLETGKGKVGGVCFFFKAFVLILFKLFKL
jgi:hypothetical protein